MHHQNYEYAAMVHSLDENVGRVLDKIDELGITDNTIVVFFSDNGGYINEFNRKVVTNNYPLRSGKGSLYEGGIREPLIIRRPGVTQPGSICAELVSSIDFYPTFLEMTSLAGDPKHNSDMDGISLVPLMKNPAGKLNRETLYWHYPHYYPTTTPVGAIRRGNWKLLEYFEDNHIELYDLSNDLGEQNDLSKKMPEKAKELRKSLVAWRKAVKAQMPTRNNG
jgi:arylsulfatase A